MVDTKSLEKKISESGYRPRYIYDNLGITRQSFDSKKKNKRKFRAAEIFTLCSLLNISDSERQEIFFAEEVNT